MVSTAVREDNPEVVMARERRVPVVPRGSGTSLAGGAMPTADSVILGVARMNAVLETDYDNRFIRVQSGRTNLSVSGAVEAEGFFYAPDPSSQLACAIAGNIAMNSGGAHCLKYGVTTNNLLGVTLVKMDGTVVTLGGPWGEPAGLDLLGVVCGSEGQLGVVTEAQARGLAIPGDIAAIGFGDFDYAANTAPPLSSVLVDRQKVGDMAADALLARLRGQEVSPKVVDVGFRIVERATT